MTVTAVGSLVRLKAGVKLTETGSSRLKPVELATITEFRDMDNEMFLKRQRDGEEIICSDVVRVPDLALQRFRAHG